MTTREDAELETVYKAGHAHSHAAGLREVYQAGRADEAHALSRTIKSLEGQVAGASEALKRPIKNPGESTTEAGSPTAQAESAPPADSAPPAPANTTPGQPAPGQNPPGEHPPSQA